jgi:hypothetical protein
MRNTATLIVFVAFSASCANTHAFLDVTRVDVRPEPGHSVEFGFLGGGCSTGASSGERVPTVVVCNELAKTNTTLPLRVSLVKLDRGAYRRMDRVRYEVSITNMSGDAIIFPWSAKRINRRDRPAHGYRHALFELIIKKSGYQVAAVDSFVLYGAPTVPGSLRVIRPNETVIVRLPGIFSGGGYQDARNPVLYPDSDRRITVDVAVFSPDERDFNFHTTSGHTLPITMLATAP